MRVNLWFGFAGVMFAAAMPVWAQNEINANGVNATAELQAGLDAYKNKDYPAAINKLVPLANKGDATAQLYLGFMNEMGQGVPQNYKRAVVRYRQAAEQGNALAQHSLGEKYELGQGVPKNKKIAAEWYRKSVVQEDKDRAAKLASQETKSRDEAEPAKPDSARFTQTEGAIHNQEAEPIKSESIPIVQKEVATRNLAVEPAKPELAKPLRFNISAFTIEGNTLLPDKKIHKVLASFIGSGRGMEDVNKAAEALHRLYQDAGYPIVQVTPPAQTIVDGKVVLKVVEDKINLVTITGNSVYSEDNIRASLPPLKQGKSLRVNSLEEAITLANENSAKQISVNVKPGEKLGDIDARIDVNEDVISKIMATLDNTGSASTGLNKFNLAYQNANMFNRDHALTVQFSGSASHPSDIYSISFGYHIPMYERGLSLDLTAAYSNSAAQNGALFFAGKGDMLGGRLNYPLSNWADIHQKLIFGADYKSSNNTFTACTGTCGNITEIPVSAMYYAQVARPTFQGSGGISLISNLTGGSNSDTAAYQAARATVAGPLQAGPIWNAWRINGSAGFMLPNDWQTRLTVNGQYSGDLLIPAEQFGLGGVTSGVRGYPERIVSGDKGYTTNLELYTPDINRFLGVSYFTSLRALMFWDAGMVSVNDNFPASLSRSTDLYSFGLGLRLAGKKNTSLKLDFGWVQKPYSNTTMVIKTGDVRGNFSFSLFF